MLKKISKINQVGTKYITISKSSNKSIILIDYQLKKNCCYSTAEARK